MAIGVAAPALVAAHSAMRTQTALNMYLSI
jgi:hypothetical protein